MESELRVEFFDLIFGAEQGYVCIATALPNARKSSFSQRFFKWPDELTRLSTYLDSASRIRDCWFCINLLSKQERKKEHCLPTNLVWADLDECLPESLTIPPQIVIRSSEKRYQAIWRLSTKVDANIAEQYSKRLAYSFKHNGADPTGWDLTQLLRVPLTTNFKYQSKPLILLERALATEAPPLIFETLPKLKPADDATLSDELPDVAALNHESIIYKYTPQLRDTAFNAVFNLDLADDEDWSKHLWRLIHICLEAGMSQEETLVVTKASKVNKYIRDNRPLSHLWRDVQKAAQGIQQFQVITAQFRPLIMPELVVEPATETLVNEYQEWAEEATDAIPQFHSLSAFIMLSAIVANSVRLDTSYGSLVPNLWGLILGDSTLTRKAQPLDAKILTNNGWKLMGEIQVGDRVIGKNGEPTEVIGISPQTTDDCYEVVFSDGAKTQCTGDHLWTIKGRGQRSKWTTWTLGEICKRGFKTNSRQIPMVEPVFQEETDLPIDPYVFGLLLGDGAFQPQGSIRFSSKDQELIDAVAEECNRLGIRLKKITGDNYDYQLTAGMTIEHGWQGWHNTLSKTIRDLGLEAHRSHEKFVPEIYLNASTRQRLALLSGLLDTDGWVNKNTIHFASSSKALAIAVQYLARSLGGWASYKVTTNKPYKDIHAVCISMPLGLNPFELKRKANKYSSRSWFRPRTIKEINYVGKKTVQCIKVEADDGLYITDDFVVTHNTTAMGMAMEFLRLLDREMVLATDGSAEGLLTGLSTRPSRTSIFYKDEISGFLDSINRKDYLAGMPETLTALYDVPPFFTRRLRKETITIENPVFIFFGGGVRDKVYELLTEEYVLSGFIPRFLVVSGDTDLQRLRRTGPANQMGLEKRSKLLEKLANIYETYATDVETHIGGQKIHMPRRISAELTPEAWNRYGDIEETMVSAANDSSIPGMALPTFERLSRSLLKMAVILGAVEQTPTGDNENKIMITEQSVINAAWYIQDWGRYSIELITNAGQGVTEKLLSKITTAISRHPGILRSTLMQHYHLTKRQADDILSTLEDRQMVRKQQQGRGWSYWCI